MILILCELFIKCITLNYREVFAVLG